MDFREIIRKNLKQAREHACLTQKELAKKIKVQLNTVSRWETGRRTIALEDAAKIARVLNISLDSFVAKR